MILFRNDFHTYYSLHISHIWIEYPNCSWLLVDSPAKTKTSNLILL